jgi:teichuronic acid biosynthesis glycosyltransferase TuaC
LNYWIEVRLGSGKIRLLTLSTLYPSSVRPGHGIFVETRLRELLGSGQVEVRVVAPVPWFFSTDLRYGEYGRMASTPAREMYNGIDVLHPRYFLPPKVGMTMAPFAMALGAIPRIGQLIADGYDFDVIDAHYYYPDGVAAALLAKHFKKPFTVTARGSDINLIANYRAPRRLIQWAARRAHASIGVSTALANAMREMGMSASKIWVMPNGVDLDLFQIQQQSSARSALGWPEGPTLLCVGNLVENKGQQIAIDALRLLPAFRLVVAGEGPDRQRLEKLVVENNLSARVLFVGRVDHSQLATSYCAADILLLPSSREGWPNVLLEAMACGTPVVANRVGGVPEIVTSDQVGRLTETRSVADLVAAVLDLWKNMPDRALVRQHAENNSWQSTTDAQIRLFRLIKHECSGATNA